jgi:NADPH:quinone reductase-like Zn-dependent oxidoreductase
MKTADARSNDEPMRNTVGVETMKAIVQDEYGSTAEDVLRLADVARPTIGNDQILVRVRAASVDRGTWHLMSGLPYPIRIAGAGLRRPKALNPGRSVAGTVDSVGKNVTEFEPGNEVYGTCDGSFAEYAVARAGRLALKPANLTFEQTAASPFLRSQHCRACATTRRFRPGRRY